MRPVIMNGIEDIVTRADLLDRSLCLTLPPIPDDQRQPEAILWQRFYLARPGILGALFDMLSCALRNLPSVHLTSTPRMADFATLIVAAEPALGWEPGAFIRVYTENRGQATELALESSIIAAPVQRLLQSRNPWTGTAGELLKQIDMDPALDDKIRKHKDWPTTPRKLSGDLRRIAPNLRQTGVTVEFDQREPGDKRRRLIFLEQNGNGPSLPSRPSQGSHGDRWEGAANPGPYGGDRP